jgi:hypothetical protein
VHWYVRTQNGRRDGNSNCDRERKKREEDLPPRSLPSNSLVNFISFYWLIFNTIYFFYFFIFFDFVSSFIILALFVMVMAISIHLIDMPLDEDCMIYQRSLADEGKAW